MIASFSPAEALGTWNGLAGYAALRALLAWLPRLILFAVIMRYLIELWRGTTPSVVVLKDLAVYTFTSLILLALFWPEALRFGGLAPTVTASEITSQVAVADGAPLQTAAQFGPGNSSVSTPEPLRLIVRIMADGWIQLARITHGAALRPFASTVPMAWLLRHKLDGQTHAAIRDWTHKCVLPAKARLLANGTTLTYENTLPFGNSALVGEMGTMTVVPARGGFWSFPGPQDARRCDTYGTIIEGSVIASMNRQRSPAGIPLATVWSQELGMDAGDVAQLLIYREVLQAAGPEIPPPSLIGQYSAVRGLRVIGSAMGGIIAGRASGVGAVGSAIAGATKGIGNELEHALDSLSNLIEPALFVTLWAPELLGMAQQVTLSLFVFVLLWCLIPGHQIRPLFAYLFVLLVLYSSPFWWASIELWTASLGTLRPAAVHNPREWLRVGIGILIGQTLGIPLVLLAMTTVLFLVSGAGSGILALVRITRGRS